MEGAEGLLHHKQVWCCLTLMWRDSLACVSPAQVADGAEVVLSGTAHGRCTTLPTGARLQCRWLRNGRRGEGYTRE